MQCSTPCCILACIGCTTVHVRYQMIHGSLMKKWLLVSRRWSVLKAALAEILPCGQVLQKPCYPFFHVGTLARQFIFFFPLSSIALCHITDGRSLFLRQLLPWPCWLEVFLGALVVKKKTSLLYLFLKIL